MRVAADPRALARGASIQQIPTGSDPSNPHGWLAATLDEVDYGMLLLADTNRLVHANRAALVELDGDYPLLLLGSELRARDPQDIGPLQAALRNAAQFGTRKLILLGAGVKRVSVSIVPLDEAMALVVLGKRRVSEPLSVQAFARSHGLTPAETRVLIALCQGVPPGEVALEHGVNIATVRSQIGSIRHKTGAESIRSLVRQVAVLPPLMSVLRLVQFEKSTPVVEADLVYAHSNGLDDFIVKVSEATPMQLADAEREGVASRFLKDVSKRMDIPVTRLFSILGIAKATAEKKVAADEVIKGNGGRAALGLAKLLGIARQIVANSTADGARDFDSAKWLGKWLERAQPVLGGRKPADLIDTAAGLDAVVRLLGSIESGTYQ